MNFFQDQRAARNATQRLIFLYGVAILITAVTLSILVLLFIYYNLGIPYYQGQGFIDYVYLNKKIFLYSFGGTCFVILSISLFKIWSLGKGGEYVARLAGATPVPTNTNDLLLRKYINVVEEMSIASGTPIPHIYIMENESGINAFAAGYNIDDCVIAVTKGTLERLSRDELQGVVAHEFSHIFNGDMRLNIKLIGYLSGILALSQIGRAIARTTRHPRRNGGMIILFGWCLMVVGYGGYLLASIIKAMISRQREYLADAAAVQFTRNPDGIGGALKKIFASSGFGLVGATHAGEVSHLFFTTAVNGFFDTHPKLPERIKRIFPRINWKRFEKEELVQLKKMLEDTTDRPWIHEVGTKAGTSIVSSFSQPMQKSDVQSCLNRAGNISIEGIATAKLALSEIPDETQKIIHDPHRAVSALYAFFVQQNNDVDNTDTLKIIDHIHNSNNQRRFSIMEIVMHTLKGQDHQTKKSILEKIKKLIIQDKKVSASEFVLYQLVKSSFFPKNKFFSQRLSQVDYYHYRKTLTDLCDHISNGKNLKLSSKEVSKALEGLNNATLKQKEDILNEVVNIVAADNTITPEEYEFIRLTSISLGVPMPAMPCA